MQNESGHRDCQVIHASCAEELARKLWECNTPEFGAGFHRDPKDSRDCVKSECGIDLPKNGRIKEQNQNWMLQGLIASLEKDRRSPLPAHATLTDCPDFLLKRDVCASTLGIECTTMLDPKQEERIQQGRIETAIVEYADIYGDWGNAFGKSVNDHLKKLQEYKCADEYWLFVEDRWPTTSIFKNEDLPHLQDEFSRRSFNNWNYNARKYCCIYLHTAGNNGRRLVEITSDNAGRSCCKELFWIDLWRDERLRR
jgi:hypothetical protein